MNEYLQSMLPALNEPSFLGITLGGIIILALAIAIIKGFALWNSARSTQKGWFWVLVFVNTLGILDLIYLIFFRRKR